MESFFAIALLIIMALLATSARLYRIRRSRMMTFLVSGGWLAVAVGIALGPAGTGLIKADIILSTTPLLVASLGWVGLMIGLQGRRELLARVPRGVFTIVALDFLATTLIIGPLSALALALWTNRQHPFLSLLEPAAALTAASLGWAMETRSLATTSNPSAQPIALVLRLTGGLAAIGAVAAFGIAANLTSPSNSADSALLFTPGAGILNLLLILALAALAGLLGRFAIGATRSTQSSSTGPGDGAFSAEGAAPTGHEHKSSGVTVGGGVGGGVGDQLAVFLGLVALVGGLAAELGSSPLPAAMLTGLFIANISTPHLLRFERFIIKAEHILAVLIFLLAGLLLNARLTWPELALAAAIALCRAVLKPALFAWGFARITANDPRSHASSFAAPAGALRFSCVRQSAVAAPIVLGLVLIEPSDFHRSLLTIVVLSGLFSALLAVSLFAWDRRSTLSLASRPGSAPNEVAP